MVDETEFDIMDADDESRKEDNIEKFYPRNAAQDPDLVLEQAIGNYKSLVIAGWNRDGSFDLRGTSNLSIAETAFLHNKALHFLSQYSEFEDD